jgi:hypothetical protein
MFPKGVNNKKEQDFDASSSCSNNSRTSFQSPVPSRKNKMSLSSASPPSSNNSTTSFQSPGLSRKNKISFPSPITRMRKSLLTPMKKTKTGSEDEANQDLSQRFEEVTEDMKIMLICKELEMAYD